MRVLAAKDYLQNRPLTRDSSSFGFYIRPQEKQLALLEREVRSIALHFATPGVRNFMATWA
jgi:hypothetical protein